MDELDSRFNEAVEILFGTFGKVTSREVISAVVESYEGDLHQSANAIMSITNDCNSNETFPVPENFENNLSESNVTSHNNAQNEEATTVSNISIPTTSYAFVSRKNAGTIPTPKETEVEPITPLNSKRFGWTEPIREIITSFNKGWRLLVIMRGVPGSGKSHQARELLLMTVGSVDETYHSHVFSTDEYFMSQGVFRYDGSRVSEAHLWNQNRACAAMLNGVSPVVIDNTNIEIWEMVPYVKEAVKNGYLIFVVEPNTPWAKNANKLFKKNTHNVPIQKIKRMLDNYQECITGDFLIKKYAFQYPATAIPPVLRNIPPFVEKSANEILDLQSVEEKLEQEKIENTYILEKDSSRIDVGEQNFLSNDVVDNKTKIICSDNIKSISFDVEIKTDIAVIDDNNTAEIITDVNENYREIQKSIDEFAKVEKQWEDGENWDEEPDKTQTKLASSCKNTLEQTLPMKALPQRPKDPDKASVTENLLTPLQSSNDWRHLSMVPSNDYKHNLITEANMPLINRNTSGTCMEMGDTDISNFKNPFKIVTTVPRDINNMYINNKIEKIPLKRMLDKSTTTSNDVMVTKIHRCQNEEKHFRAFRKMFNNVNSNELRDIFENCCGDVNWAVEIVIDGMTNKQLNTTDNDNVLSDDEGETKNVNQCECECIAAYNVIPDHRLPALEESKITEEPIPSSSTAPYSSPRRLRKESSLSEGSLQLKRQIEKNVVISENHYSDHYLKIRKARNRDNSNADSIDNVGVENDVIGEDETKTSDSTQSEDIPGLSNNSPSLPDNPSNLPTTTEPAYDEDHNMSDDDSITSTDDFPKTVNVYVGNDFIKQLDMIYGRKQIEYPENISPNINMPINFLNEINALWMESIMHQLEEETKQTKVMVQQDAEFARLIASKEQEMALSGKEPGVPDFKEIMDMDYALSLYQKDVAEWRNKEPSDLAAKLTRDKLYNLFPDVSSDVLSELLMAHDNNFQATVEVLLMSTGKSDILEQENGLNKFIMDKEMERKELLLQEERKALSEVEWPLLPQGKAITMDVVNDFRRQAAQHLEQRNVNHRKAQEYVQRDMVSAANYYWELGAFHTKRYEQANSLAAVSLIQVNAKNCPDNSTIDLHHYRVAEALESLDIFLDLHIKKLKEINGRNGVRCQSLFFITGRGRHSPGGPRIKPAVKKRLTERGIFFSESNPGLLTAKVHADHKLTHEIA